MRSFELRCGHGESPGSSLGVGGSGGSRLVVNLEEVRGFGPSAGHYR